MACLENVGWALPPTDPKLVVLDYWGIFAYFPNISLFRQNFSFLLQMHAVGETSGEWLLHNYSAFWQDFWHLDHRRHAIVTHWFRLRISVGAVRIHHLEGKNVQESQNLTRSPIRPFFAPRWQFWEPITYWEPKFPFWVPIWPFWDDFRKRRGELGGFKCLLAAPVLPPCCHHLDPVKKTAWPDKSSN